MAQAGIGEISQAEIANGPRVPATGRQQRFFISIAKFAKRILALPPTVRAKRFFESRVPYFKLIVQPAEPTARFDGFGRLQLSE